MTLLILIVFLFFLFILFVIALIAFRRWRRGVYFKKLDRETERIITFLQKVLEKKIDLNISDWKYPPHTVEWEALEKCLIQAKTWVNEEGKRTIEKIFQELGYSSFYQSLLSKGNRWERALAAERLGIMGGSKESVKVLLRALKDPSKEVRSISLRSLAQIADENFLPLLIEELPYMATPEKGVFGLTLKNALLKIGESILPFLLPQIKEYPLDILSMVIESLGEIGSPKAVPVLISLLSHSHPEIRSKAARALGKMKDLSVVPALLRMENEHVWYVRLQVCRALGLLKDHRGIHFLMNHLLDTNWQVRAAAAEALLKIESAAFSAIAQTLKESKDRFAREQIAEEMQRCGIVEELIHSLGQPYDASMELKKDLLRILASLGIKSLMEWASKTHPSKVVREEIMWILKSTESHSSEVSKSD
ncbi:MAG: HEAT repeat domain-containing protein [Thermodesulfobacteriota bacterium]